MIGISKLYCGVVEPSDPLRYQRKSNRLPSELLQFSADKKPIVVWNCTKQCNLKCAHCYASSGASVAPDELSTTQARSMIDDIAAFGAPVLLFSGGEPLMRHDLLELIDYARAAGLRTVVSTNGTLLTDDTVAKLRAAGVGYVGISLDAPDPESNDAFRGAAGAFNRALAGIRCCISAGVKVGLRFTAHHGNTNDVEAIFNLLQREKIPRVCFYHLVSAGRGKQLTENAQSVSHQQTRAMVDVILRRTRKLHAAGILTEVLTVDNHTDGAYLYMKLLEEDPQRAADVYKLLQFNGGNSSGVGVACVSWNGDVHPDQFWRDEKLGNVQNRPFGKIWSDPDNELLKKLRNRHEYLSIRCKNCRFLDICNGNLRIRSISAGNGVWGDDPGCYLTDSERKIGKK
ncbi:MAG: radical SAM protein [Phycisphaerae bacterium]|nr:radical SAM protein [Phycisphaerae bacterium]